MYQSIMVEVALDLDPELDDGGEVVEAIASALGGLPFVAAVTVEPIE